MKLKHLLILTLTSLMTSLSMVNHSHAQTPPITIDYTTSDNLSITERTISETQRSTARITFYNNGSKLTDISQISLANKTGLPAESLDITAAYIFSRDSFNQNAITQFTPCNISSNGSIKTTTCTLESGLFDYLRLTFEPVGPSPNPGILFMDSPYGFTITAGEQEYTYNRSLSFTVPNRPPETSQQSNTEQTPPPPNSNQTPPPTNENQTSSPSSSTLQQMVDTFPETSINNEYNLMTQFKLFIQTNNSFFQNLYPNNNFPYNFIFYHWIENNSQPLSSP